MAHDKKAKNGRLTLILASGVGRAYIHRDAEIEGLKAFLERECVG